jgi:hypothetical protein
MSELSGLVIFSDRAKLIPDEFVSASGEILFGRASHCSERPLNGGIRLVREKSTITLTSSANSERRHAKFYSTRN